MKRGNLRQWAVCSTHWIGARLPLAMSRSGGNVPNSSKRRHVWDRTVHCGQKKSLRTLARLRNRIAWRRFICWGGEPAIAMRTRWLRAHWQRHKNSGAIQTEALANLGRMRGNRVGEILINVWKSGSPSVRLKVMDELLSRREWTEGLMAALEAGKIPGGVIGTAQQQKLLNHPETSIRERAKKLFAATSSDREAVVGRYKLVNGLKGDEARGAGYFKANCTPCHRLQNEGNEVGPDLGSVAFKPAEYLVTAILDPSLSVEARYTSYTAVTKNDQEYSGIVSAETANSITMRLPGGTDVVILRNELKELTSNGRSLMPDGFENRAGIRRRWPI